jgi:hypothetical protein
MESYIGSQNTLPFVVAKRPTANHHHSPIRMIHLSLRLQPLTRWVLPPHSSVSLVVQFRLEDVGRITESVAFEALCGDRPISVTVMGSCDYPRINIEPK